MILSVEKPSLMSSQQECMDVDENNFWLTKFEIYLNS